MTIEVRVGPPIITINQGDTFMVTDQRGEIDFESEQGVFSGDTRFVSFYKVYTNLKPWELLTSSAVSYYASRFHLVNPAITTEDGEIAPQQLSLTITRTVGHGIHEDLDVVNFAMHPVRFMLEIALRSDFADIFEVKTHKFVRRGRITTRWEPTRCELVNAYDHKDFHRRLVYKIICTQSQPQYDNGRVVLEIALGPGESWHACALYVLAEGERVRHPNYDCPATLDGGIAVDELQRQWVNEATRLTSANEDVYRAYRQSVEDIGALRLHDHDMAPNVWVAGAGVPWFMTLFGRDSLIVSSQSMMVNGAFALGALKKLAEYQSTETDDWRDAEPGKILHELRSGELAHFRKIPHTPYYGTADATILYLIVLHETWKWLGDTRILGEHRDVALRCLEWIDRYGDLDGDGFQEYKTRSPQGYENMSWKDSGDGVVYPDGSQVKQPKALCELQGYVFDAKLRMAEVFDVLEEPDRAEALRKQALVLQQRFDEAFWMDDEGFIAYGLDSEKRQIKTTVSNPGHCLWSGIVRKERAEQVVRRLLEEDMWSGWGIRTLSSTNPAYNPFSYHLGSVWPHDNGIIAMGFKRYGFAEEANQVARAVFDAARYFASYRLPELYAGLPRRSESFPVQYLGANIPQAWAAGSLFHLLQAMLGLRADAPAGRLCVEPTLSEWLPQVELENLRIGGSTLHLRFWREGTRSRWEVVEQEGTITVEGP